MKKILVFTVFLILASSCAEDDYWFRVFLQGRVEDAATATPLTNAEICFVSFYSGSEYLHTPYHTDAKGQFTILEQDLSGKPSPTAEFICRASATGYYPQYQTNSIQHSDDYSDNYTNYGYICTNMVFQLTKIE